MNFENEPDYIKAARQVPVRSTWESRQPYQARTVPAKAVLPARTDTVFEL